MNHKRKEPRMGNNTRGRSSTWVYPRASKGDERRSRPSAKRAVMRAVLAVKEHFA
jgi:hypothetical protein